MTADIATLRQLLAENGQIDLRAAGEHDAAILNALPDLLDRLERAEGAVERVRALADVWESDAREHLNRFGQHLMGGAVESCAEHLRAALDATEDEGETE